MPGPRRATRRRPAHLREDAHLFQPPRALLRGNRRERRAPRQLPPSLHPPGHDQRRGQPRPATLTRVASPMKPRPPQTADVSTATPSIITTVVAYRALILGL